MIRFRLLRVRNCLLANVLFESESLFFDSLLVRVASRVCEFVSYDYKNPFSCETTSVVLVLISFLSEARIVGSQSECRQTVKQMCWFRCPVQQHFCFAKRVFQKKSSGATSTENITYHLFVFESFNEHVLILPTNGLWNTSFTSPTPDSLIRLSLRRKPLCG